MDWTIGSILKEGFRTWKQHWVLVTALFIFSFILPLIPHGLQNLVSEEAALTKLFLALLGFFFTILADMGFTTIVLKAAKNEEYQFSDFFSRFEVLPSFLCAYLLNALAVIFGLLLFIIPGIIFALKFSFFRFYVIEDSMKGVEALRKSNETTYGHKWKILGFWIVAAFINILGALFFGIGWLITAPVVALAWAHLFFLLTSRKEIV